MKFMRTYLFLIIINILFISCDFEEINSFEMPAWNWPLSFPLIDENYTFGAMGANDNGDGIFINGEGDTVQTNNIFFDEDSTLFIEYSAELVGENGDSIGVNNDFSSYFEITPPAFDNVQGINFADDGSNISFDIPEINVPISLPLGLVAYEQIADLSNPGLYAPFLIECFLFHAGIIGSDGYTLPDNIDIDDDGIADLPTTQQLFDPNEIGQLTNDSFSSLEYITIDEGFVTIELTNNYPFEVAEVEVIFSSNDDVLFLDDNGQNTFIFSDVDPETTLAPLTFNISSTNLVNLSSDLTIDLRMVINDQTGNGEVNIYNNVPSNFPVCYGTSSPDVTTDTWFLCNDDPDFDPPTANYECTDENNLEIDPITDINLDLGLQINFQNVKSITGSLNADTIKVVENVNMQGNQQGIDIVGGQLCNGSDCVTDDDDVDQIFNELTMDIDNNLFTDVDFSIEFPNFSSQEGEILKFNRNIPIGGGVEETLEFSGLYLFNAILENENDENSDWISSPGTSLENIVVITSIIINDGSVTFDLSENYGLAINSLSFAPLKLNYVTAAAENLEFDVPPFTMENIPSGFEGFEFADLSLTFDIKNQIGIPVALDLNLTGKKENGDSVTLIIDPELAYNNVDVNGDFFIDDGASLKDSAKTVIVFDKNGQTTKKYIYSTEWTLYDEETVTASDGISTIVDVMSIAPDEINVSGGAAISGNGILAPKTYLWGDFIMQSALSFVFSKNISFIPGEPTVLEPLDESTRSKIDSSLVIAKLSLDIINSIPIDGNIGLLVSDYNPDSLCLSVDDVLCSETYFPVYFDDLTEGDWFSQSGEISEGYESEFTQDSLLMEYLGVSKITVKLDEDDEISYINFVNDDSDTLFFVGRMFNLEIAEPDSINSTQGTTVVPSVYTDEIILNKDRVNWITSDRQIFLKPLIRFNATDDFYCNDGSECDEGICDNGSDCIIEPRTFQTSNSINISSFITFTLNTGSLFETTKSKKLSELKQDNVNY